MMKSLFLYLIAAALASQASSYCVFAARARFSSLCAASSQTPEEGKSLRPISPVESSRGDLRGLGRVGGIVLSSLLASQSALVGRVTSVQAAPAPSDKTVVVLGGAGKTASLIIDKALKEGVCNIVPTFRGSPRDYGAGIVSKQADVTQLSSIGAAIEGASAVIFAASASSKGGNAKAVDFEGVRNVALECVRLKVPRLVVISSGAITKRDSLGFKITNLFGGIMDEKRRGEDALREIYAAAAKDDASLSYVIVRPGGLTDGSAVGAGAVELNQGDTWSGEINRSDVADAVLAAALSPAFKGKKVTFEIYNRGGKGPLEGRFNKPSGYEVAGVAFDDMFAALKEGVSDLQN